MSPIYVPGKVVLRKDYIPLDASYNNVSLLLHGNGPNGSTVFTDNSPTPKTVTAVGNAQISTAQSKFGGASIYLDGTGDGASIASNTAFAFGANDFTIETWVYPVSVSGNPNLFDTRPSGNGAWPVIYFDGGRLRYFLNTADRISGSTVLAANTTWYHIALSRAGSSTKLFLNGTQEGSTYSDSTLLLEGPFALGIDSRNLTSGPFNAYFDDVRVTKGIARYTANFTPPTEPFPDRTDG
jgi:hypothetical protein